MIRDAWCLEIMHRAFVDGLMEYGMITARKPLSKACHKRKTTLGSAT